jgi:hypothetical protein
MHTIGLASIRSLDESNVENRWFGAHIIVANQSIGQRDVRLD